MMELLSRKANFTLISADQELLTNDFAADVEKGLTSTPKFLHSKYFYDEIGSQLFEQICELEEYYPTRAETEILRTRSGEIAANFDRKASIVEFGSGSSTKTRLLINAFLERFGGLRYVPIDISRSILEESAQELLNDYPGLDIHAIRATYQGGLDEIGERANHPRLVLFLGSNIGNFERDVALRFLRNIRELMGPDDRFLLGVDLKKDRSILEAAYNDSRGVTARFNLNLLERINRELGGEFNQELFMHSAKYNENEGRIELHLGSKRDQFVYIRDLDIDISFREGERIHTENSHKFLLSEIDSMAKEAGFMVVQRWLDGNELFSLNLLAP